MSLGDKIESGSNKMLGLSSVLCGTGAGAYTAHLTADMAALPEGASIMAIPGGIVAGLAMSAQLTHRNNIGENIDGLNPLHEENSKDSEAAYREEDPLNTHPEDIREIKKILEPEEQEEIIELADDSMTVHEELDNVLGTENRGLLSKIFQPSYDPTDHFSDEYGLFLTIGSEAKKEEVSETVEKIVYDEVKGLKGEYKLLNNNSRSSVFWATYVDRDQETLLQAPRKGKDFQDRLERVERVRENKRVLDEADKYIDDVLEKEENKKVSHGTVDYEWLQENEDLVRNEIEDGIETASQNYETAIVESNGTPVPVIVADYNEKLDEWVVDTDYNENKERFKAVGKYIDALVEQEIFTAVPNDYFDEYEGINDMYINGETGDVEVSDLGELPGYVDNKQTRPKTPEVSVKT